MFGHGYTLSDAQYQDIYTSTDIDVDGRRQHGHIVAMSVEIFVYSFIKFSKGVPGFFKLPLEDQAALLKEGWVDVWFLAAHRGFLQNLRVFFAPNKDCQTWSELCRSFGSGWVESSFRLARRIQRLGLTKEEVVVLSAVCILSSDRCVLQAAKTVDELQWFLVTCLVHLLRHSHGACSMVVLGKVMGCVAEVRSVSNETKQSLMASHFTDIIQNHPLLVDILE